MSSEPASTVLHKQDNHPVAFISYAREDRDLVMLLAKELAALGVEVTGDWLIPPSVPYMKALHSYIEAANTFVFVISEHSVQSRACREEIDYAFGLNKRLAPVVIQLVEDDLVHAALRTIQYVFILKPEDLGAGARSILLGIEVDLEWERKHNRLLRRALDWSNKGRNESLTLRKADLQEAEMWLSEATADQNKKPRPTQLHIEYINASRKDEKKRQRVAFVAVSAGLIIAIALGLFAFVKRGEAMEREQEAQQQRAIAQKQTVIAEAQTRIANSQTRIAEYEKTIANTQRQIAEEKTKIAEEQKTIAEAQTSIATQQRALAVSAAEEARRRLITLYEERGRQASVSGDAQSSLMYLSEAYKERESFTKLDDNPSLRFLLAWGSWPFKGQFASLNAHKNRIFSVEFSRDGKRVLTASFDSSAKLWDATTGALISTVGGYEQSLHGAYLSPNGSSIVTIGSRYEPADGENYGDYVLEAHLFKASGGLIEEYLLAKEPSDDGPSFKPIFSSDSRTVELEIVAESVSDEAEAKLVDTASGEDVTPANFQPTTRQKDPVTSAGLCSLKHSEILDVDAKGEFLIKTQGSTAEIWDTRTCRQIRQLDGLSEGINIAKFSPDGSAIISAGDDNRAILWKWREIAAPVVAAMRTDAVDAYFCDDGQNVALQTRDGKVMVQNLSSNQLTELGKAAISPTIRSAISADGMRALIEGKDKTVELWDVPNHKLLRRLIVGKKAAKPWGFNPNGKYLVTQIGDPPDVVETSDIHVWDATSGKCLGTMKVPGGDSDLDSIALSWDGTRVFGSAKSRTAEMWVSDIGWTDVTAFDNERMHAGKVTYSTFSRNGERVLTAGEDGTVKLWDVQNGHLIRTLGVPKGGVEYAAFSPDDTRIITVNDDGTIKLWESNNDDPLFTSVGHSSYDIVTFSPDNNFVLTVDSSAKIWDAKRGQLLMSINIPDAKVSSAAFSLSEKRIVTSSSDGIMRIWDVDDDKRDASSVAQWVARVIPLRLEAGRLRPAR